MEDVDCGLAKHDELGAMQRMLGSSNLSSEMAIQSMAWSLYGINWGESKCSERLF